MHIQHAILSSARHETERSKGIVDWTSQLRALSGLGIAIQRGLLGSGLLRSWSHYAVPVRLSVCSDNVPPRLLPRLATVVIRLLGRTCTPNWPYLNAYLSVRINYLYAYLLVQVRYLSGYFGVTGSEDALMECRTTQLSGRVMLILLEDFVAFVVVHEGEAEDLHAQAG